MSDRIFAVNGVSYTSQKIFDLYLASGTASDWYVGLLNEVLFFKLLFYLRFYSDKANENNGQYRAAGFTMELRDNGTYSFLLPPDQVTSKFHSVAII